MTGADGKGSIEINPTISSEYTITVDTPEEEGASESVNIQVSLVGSFPLLALINSGEEATLNWIVGTLLFLSQKLEKSLQKMVKVASKWS